MSGDLFLYADEAVDHLVPALDRARQVRDIGLAADSGDSLSPGQAVITRQTISKAIEDCQNAITALLATRGEL